MTQTTLPRVRPTSKKRRGRGVRVNFALALGLAILVTLALLATVGAALSPYDANAIGVARFLGPSRDHLLGTDNLGRDVFTRTIVSARADIIGSLLASLLAATIGTCLGLVAGFKRGWVDTAIMRVIDIGLSVPSILFALLIGVTFGPGLWTLVVSLGLVFAPVFARVMRAPALVLSQREFVVAAEVNGLSSFAIIVRHLLPNALGPLMVQFANTASVVIMLGASLSYLGQGVQPPSPSAGRMVSEAQRFLTDAPLVLLAPMALIVAMTFAWNLLADGLQRSLTRTS